jgi:hypothetical protein
MQSVVHEFVMPRVCIPSSISSVVDSALSTPTVASDLLSPAGSDFTASASQYSLANQMPALELSSSEQSTSTTVEQIVTGHSDGEMKPVAALSTHQQQNQAQAIEEELLYFSLIAAQYNNGSAAPLPPIGDDESDANNIKNELEGQGATVAVDESQKEDSTKTHRHNTRKRTVSTYLLNEGDAMDDDDDDYNENDDRPSRSLKASAPKAGGTLTNLADLASRILGTGSNKPVATVTTVITTSGNTGAPVAASAPISKPAKATVTTAVTASASTGNTQSKSSSLSSTKRPDGRIFSCSYPNCSYKSNRSSNVITHERTHSGERPFKCDSPGCDYSATHKSNLKVHLKLHGGGVTTQRISKLGVADVKEVIMRDEVTQKALQLLTEPLSASNA